MVCKTAQVWAQPTGRQGFRLWPNTRVQWTGLTPGPNQPSCGLNSSGVTFAHSFIRPSTNAHRWAGRLSAAAGQRAASPTSLSRTGRPARNRCPHTRTAHPRGARAAGPQETASVSRALSARPGRSAALRSRTPRLNRAGHGPHHRSGFGTGAGGSAGGRAKPSLRRADSVSPSGE